MFFQVKMSNLVVVASGGGGRDIHTDDDDVKDTSFTTTVVTAATTNGSKKQNNHKKKTFRKLFRYYVFVSLFAGARSPVARRPSYGPDLWDTAPLYMRIQVNLSCLDAQKAHTVCKYESACVTRD